MRLKRRKARRNRRLDSPQKTKARRSEQQSAAFFERMSVVHADELENPTFILEDSRSGKRRREKLHD